MQDIRDLFVIDLLLLRVRDTTFALFCLRLYRDVCFVDS